MDISDKLKDKYKKINEINYLKYMYIHKCHDTSYELLYDNYELLYDNNEFLMEELNKIINSEKKYDDIINVLDILTSHSTNNYLFKLDIILIYLEHLLDINIENEEINHDNFIKIKNNINDNLLSYEKINENNEKSIYAIRNMILNLTTKYVIYQKDKQNKKQLLQQQEQQKSQIYNNQYDYQIVDEYQKDKQNKKQEQPAPQIIQNIQNKIKVPQKSEQQNIQQKNQEQKNQTSSIIQVQNNQFQTQINQEKQLQQKTQNIKQAQNKHHH
jgi:hypothetical protein